MPPTSGTLYLVATPIGNLQDITLRALRVLGEVDVVAAEDTRHTRKLLSAHNIRRPLLSYREHNMRTQGARLVRQLLAGKSVALVTDAGTPGISDPGIDLVRQAALQGIRVSPVPGPSAVTTALTVAGLAGTRYSLTLTVTYIRAALLPATPRSQAASSPWRIFFTCLSTTVFTGTTGQRHRAIQDIAQYQITMQPLTVGSRPNTPSCHRFARMSARHALIK